MAQPIATYTGLAGCSRGWLSAHALQGYRHLLIVCSTRRESEGLLDDLRFFERTRSILSLPSWEILPFESVSPQPDLSGERLATLAAIQAHQPFVAIASIDALLQRVLPPEILPALTRTLRVGEQIGRDEILQHLQWCGYNQVTVADEVGEYALRGLVIDCFPAHLTTPVRFEFDAGRIARIKRFDPDSQRSFDLIEQITLFPVRETISLAARGRFADLLPAALERIKRRGRELETPPREIAKITAAIRSGSDFPGAETIMALALERLSSVFELFPKDLTIVLNDRAGIERVLEERWKLIEEREGRLAQEHYLIPRKESLYVEPAALMTELTSRPHVLIDHLEVIDEDSPTARDEAAPKSRNLRVLSLIELTTKLKTQIGSGEAFKPLADAIHSWRRKGYVVACAIGSHTRAERLHRLLLDLNLDAPVLDLAASEWIESSARAPLAILHGHISAGARLPREKLVFIAEHEIFGERSYRAASRSKASLKRLLASLGQLQEGDYVVHIDYGIGIYHGLTHLEIEGTENDFLNIQYADSTLYLPVHSIAKIQKFSAAEGAAPALDKLSSTRWAHTKQKIKESVLPLAGDLIKLYAARSVAKGWRFEPMGAEDERFADEFPYNETPDQQKAIEETIGDMASEKPMDRLVCGDVGFGKTEVALRAAFKCAQHARQVAMLVPTTLLVDQHYRNFLSRFKGHDVRVGAVSRFYSAHDNRKTLEKLATGELDIIIGTHRLLQKDVSFKDLGLVIVDEEHRFGVKQKERLKSLKKQVDVLTLTATPIPRTLHMSLLGIRDISVISSPPADRKLIRTYIAASDDALIRDTIMRELQRGGQCFFVHNRIQSIQFVTDGLRELVPEARFEFAHGQMSEHQLEAIMRRFINREIDILVSTTIVESGIDIPNANTIIIDRADTYGLAQLYQLRGRVGRSKEQAYAYFIIPKQRKITSEAQQRLKALQSLDNLGLGFNLALRDLEIRGAGNLLGKEQSGNVLAVGFDLYTRILKEAVLHLKGEEVELEETIEPEVKIGIQAFVPEFYIPDLSERLVLYQRLAGVRDDREMDELSSEIEDRFGPMPREVFNLVELMRFRSAIRRYGVVKVERIADRTMISFAHRAPIDPDKVFALVKKHPERYRFTRNLTLTVSDGSDRLSPNLYGELRALLKRIGIAGFDAAQPATPSATPQP